MIDNIDNKKQAKPAKDYLRVTDSEYILAEDYKEISKCEYYLVENKNQYFVEKHISLNNIETDKNHRRKGYATELITYMLPDIKWIKKINIVSVSIDKDNTPAIKLYHKFGFKHYLEHNNKIHLAKHL